MLEAVALCDVLPGGKYAEVGFDMEAANQLSVQRDFVIDVQAFPGAIPGGAFRINRLDCGTVGPRWGALGFRRSAFRAIRQTLRMMLGTQRGRFGVEAGRRIGRVPQCEAASADGPPVVFLAAPTGPQSQPREVGARLADILGQCKR
jgi:hypothetical protein